MVEAEVPLNGQAVGDTRDMYRDVALEEGQRISYLK